jgi:hypothetical protein
MLIGFRCSEGAYYGPRLTSDLSSNYESSSCAGSVTPAATPDFYDANYDESSTAISGSSSGAVGNGCSLSGFGQPWPPTSSPAGCPTQTFTSMALTNSSSSSGTKSAALYAGQLSHVEDDVAMPHHRSNFATNISSVDTELYYNGGSTSLTPAPSSPFCAQQQQQQQQQHQVVAAGGKPADPRCTASNDDRADELHTPAMSGCNKRHLADDGGRDVDTMATVCKKSRYSDEHQTAEDGGKKKLFLTNKCFEEKTEARQKH